MMNPPLIHNDVTEAVVLGEYVTLAKVKVTLKGKTSREITSEFAEKKAEPIIVSTSRAGARPARPQGTGKTLA